MLPTSLGTCGLGNHVCTCPSASVLLHYDRSRSLETNPVPMRGTSSRSRSSERFRGPRTPCRYAPVAWHSIFSHDLRFAASRPLSMRISCLIADGERPHAIFKPSGRVYVFIWGVRLQRRSASSCLARLRYFSRESDAAPLAHGGKMMRGPVVSTHLQTVWTRICIV